MGAQPATTQEARSALDRALSDLCRDFNTGVFTPILEADVAGYLYHRLLTNGCAPNTVYLATRVCGDTARSRKPDLVIGTLNQADACIRPILICELKVFQRWGHSDQQIRHRMAGILAEDLPSLAQMSEVLPNGRVEVIADLYVSSQRRGYMTGTWDGENRLQRVSSECNRIGAELIWIHTASGGSEITIDKIL